MFQRLLTVPILLFTSVVLVVIVGALLLLQFNNPFGKSTKKVDVSRPTVLKEIQELGRLETAQFTLEKVIEAGTQSTLFKDVLTGSRVLLIAHGRITAGVDLSQVSDADVDVLGNNLRIKLPKADIFEVALDSSKTKVYDRRLGLVSVNDKNIASESARRAAQDAIKRAACEAGILDVASKNAHDRMKQMFQLVGFTEVYVDIPQSGC